LYNPGISLDGGVADLVYTKVGEACGFSALKAEGIFLILFRMLKNTQNNIR